MGSFSIWHWVIALGIIAIIPVIFAMRSPPPGPNRFGGLPYAMDFVTAVSTFFKNYTNFSTRASRSEFWYCVLFLILASTVLNVIDRSGLLSIVFSFATITPTIAQNTRRLHDINRSGWHQLLWLILPIGWVVLIVWYCTPAPDGVALTRGTTVKPGKDTVEALEKLMKLRESGALTQEEFETEKRKILGSA